MTVGFQRHSQGMRKLQFIAALALAILARPLAASAQGLPGLQSPDRNNANAICLMIQSAARANALPVDFFARLIWVESRFRADEIGPLTYTGQRAQGIAQFMPGTAFEHGLIEPFNPIEALPKSGEFLAQLRDQFGNLGLAAAAYNAGPDRVREFLAGSRDLPWRRATTCSRLPGAQSRSGRIRPRKNLAGHLRANRRPPRKTPRQAVGRSLRFSNKRPIFCW